MNILFHIVVLAGLLCSQSYGQTWRSTFYSSNWTPPKTKDFYTDAFLQDYSYAGYHRGEVSLPTPNGTIYDVTKAPYNADNTGTNDATSAIQSAISAAVKNGGGVVYLPTGTYAVNPGTNSFCLQINGNNVVLKGDGIGKTFILNTTYQMNNKKIISVTGTANWSSIPSTKALLTADVMNPVNVLPIDNPSLFKVGDLVMVRNVIGDPWITEHKETGWLTYGPSLNGIMYCRYITAIDAANKTITVDVPLRYALKTRDGACVFPLNGMASEIGLQDFSIGNVENPATTGFAENDYTIARTAGYQSHSSYAIRFSTTINSWIKNVATFQATGNTTGTHILSNGILIDYCKNVTLENCTMSYAQYGGGGGNGYAFRLSSNETLVNNCTATHTRHGFVFSSMWCSGNVIHQCNDVKTGFQCGNTGNMTTSGYGSDHHMHFSQSNLIDNSYTENSGFYAYYRNYGTNPMHLLTATHTAYWNIASGGTKAYSVWTQQVRYGYAIGTSGPESVVMTSENYPGSAAKTDPVDIVEGQGLGATLSPQSLYLDQLAKRTTGTITGLDEKLADADLSVFPNPSTTSFSVQSSQDIKQLLVYDTGGQEIFNSSYTTQRFGETWRSGLYLVKVQKADGSFVFKKVEKAQ